MTPTAYKFCRDLVLQAMIYVSTQRPRDWCVQHLYFDEPGNRGPFRLSGREYIADILDDFANPLVNDEVLVMGSQTGKTGGLMGGAAYKAVNIPGRFLWGMPSLTLAQSFSNTRWKAMLKASPITSDLIPKGADRHSFKALQQRLGSSLFDFVGSNSPANLSSNPCQNVILDETDKFDQQGGGGEAGAANLADQRTKGQANAQRWKTSTPTLVEGLIWQEFLKGNQCRYDVPCPLCLKLVLLAWSSQYTIMAKTGREAYVTWDEAKRESGEWDLDRVHRSARFTCPHCHGDILDSKKTWMIRDGIWTPTNPNAAKNFISRQLSSLYATAPETSCGNLAVKFLQAKNSLLGLQGFINGDLAEPFQSQDTQGKRTERIVERIEVTAEWKKEMTVDCQAKAPYFWFVKRAWNGPNSEGFEAGSADTWTELETLQRKDSIHDVNFSPDSGYNARSGEADVYRACVNHGEFVDRQDMIPIHVGWTPMKGFPGRKRWPDKKTGLLLPYIIRGTDPYMGTSMAGRLEMNLLEFSSDYFMDILDNLRNGRVKGFEWRVVSSMATETYWNHMDAKRKIAVQNKRTGSVTYQWLPRSRNWPDHIGDCEIMQIVKAAFFGYFELP